MRNSDEKVKKYRRPTRINIIIVIFVLIAVYVVIFLVGYIKSKPITGYEVKEGSLFVANNYNGIALRNETVVNSQDSGYVNYYTREGEKVACGDLVYSVDGSGKLLEMLTADAVNNTALTEEDLTEIKNDIIRFSKDFDEKKFSSVYDFKYELDGTTLKLANLNILNNLNSGSSLGNVKMRNAEKAGYVVYNIDGYENLTTDDITKDTFDTKDYEKNQFLNNALIEAGDPVYKYIDSEDWKVIIQLESEERAAEFEEEGYVYVKFLKTQTSSWGQVRIFRHGEDIFCELSFNSSMVSFCTDRFVEIEVKTNDDVGLKIPNSAIAEKEFYLIPKEYCLGINQAQGTYKFLKESFMEDGTKSSQLVDLTVYGENEDEYYISTEGLNTGDYFLIENSDEKFAISKKGSLIGVYNINKGYADFRQITIMYQNDDYAIVKSNSNYGLNAYDYIAYDAEAVSDDDLIYE